MDYLKTDDAWIIKYMQAGCDFKTIATKLGRTEKDIKQRWEEILLESKRAMSTGLGCFVESFNNLCSQYQLLGESLKVIGGAIEEPDLKAVEACIAAAKTPREAAISLMNSFIVLKVFIPKEPSKVLEETLQGN